MFQAPSGLGVQTGPNVHCSAPRAPEPMPGDPQSHQNICTRHGAGTLTSPERLDSGTQRAPDGCSCVGGGRAPDLPPPAECRQSEGCRAVQRSAVQRSAGAATLAWTVRGMRGATALQRCSAVQAGAARCSPLQVVGGSGPGDAPGIGSTTWVPK